MPKLRFPGFEEEWEECQFINLFSTLPNNTLSRAELSETGEIKNIHYGDVLIKFGDTLDIKNDTIPYVKNKVTIQKNEMYLTDGDIVVADTAEDETVGKATELFNAQGIKVVAGLHTIPCRPQKHFASKYLGYYMNSIHYHKQLITLMQGIKVLSISKSNIAKTIVRYPSINEQEKISSFISLLDEHITKQRELVESLKSYKRGVLSAIFNAVFQFKKLKEISEYITSDLSLECVSKESTGEFPVYNAGGISSYISSYKVESDYIAIIKDGSGVGRLQYCNGRSSFIGTLGGIIANGCSTAYLYAAMQMINFRQFITGATIPHVYYKDYKNLSIPFPEFKVQKSIEDVSELLGRDISISEEKLNLLIDFKAELLRRLFI